MNDVSKLIQFRNYMMPTREQFIRMYLLDQSILESIKELKQVKKDILDKRKMIFYFVLGLFLYGIIGVILSTVLIYIKDNPFGLNLLYKYLYINNSEYITLGASLVYFIGMNIYFSYKKHSKKQEIVEMKVIKKILSDSLKGIYKKYNNPPVMFELSMPDTLTELIKYMNTDCDTIDESVNRFVEDYKTKNLT